MDDDSQQDGGERINVTIGGSRPAATPVALPPAEPVAPPAPEPVAPPAPEEVPSAPELDHEPAPAPPTPGSVVTGGDGVASGPPPSTATAQPDRPKGGKRWLKILLSIILIAALAAAGWLVYDKFIKPKPVAAPQTARNRDINLLRIGVVQANYGDKLYPDMVSNEYSFMTNSQMFEGLVRYENKSKIVPDLASNWTNPDSKTWLFTIKDGVTFHDGNTLTAHDVKYSLDTVIAKNPDLAQTYAGTIDKVELVGRNQVRITTKDPDPTLLNKLTFLYVFDAKLPKNDEPSMGGTGPYYVKPGTTPSDSSVQMVAFNQYHGGTPKTKALDFGRVKSGPAAVTALNANKYDIVGPIPLDDASQAQGATKFISSEADTRFIGFNTVAKGPLQNKLVRQAIRDALDPTAIGQAAGDQVTPLDQLIPESIPGYDPAIEPFKQDTAEAKRLLAKAGYPNGLTLTLSSSSDPKAEAEIVKQLKAVGITVKIDHYTDFDKFISAFTGGQTQMFTVDYSSDTLDGLDVYNSILLTPNYNNPKVTKLLDQVSSTTDPAERLKLLQEVAVIVNDDIPVVPLSTQNDIWLMNKPYDIKQDAPSNLISVYFYKAQLP